jgi:hypothetical protein
MSYREQIEAAVLKAESIQTVIRPIYPKYKGLRSDGPDARVEIGIRSVEEADPQTILVSSLGEFATLMHEVMRYSSPETPDDVRKRRVFVRTRYAKERLEAAHLATGALGWVGVRAYMEYGAPVLPAVDIPRRTALTALELASIVAAPDGLSTEFDIRKLRDIGYNSVQEVGSLIVAHNLKHPDHPLYIPQRYNPDLG